MIKDTLRHRVKDSLHQIVVISVGLLLFSFWLFNTYDIKNSVNHPSKDVVSITRSDAQSKFEIGRSPFCGHAECWMTENFSDVAWTKLPDELHDIRADQRLKNSFKNSSAYYRMQIRIPEFLKDRTDLAFSPRFVYHKNFEIYADGEKIFSGSGTPGSGKSTIVPLPLHLTRDGIVNVAVKGSLGPDEPGLVGRGSMFLGPQTDLNQLLQMDRVQLREYFFSFFVMKVGLFVFFAICYFFSNGIPGIKFLIAFIGCSALDSLAIGNFFSEHLSINTRVTLFAFLRTAGAIFLANFFIHFLKAPISDRTKQWVSSLALIGAALLVSSFNFMPRPFFASVDLIIHYVNFLEWVTFSGALGFTIHKIAKDAKNRAPRIFSFEEGFAALLALVVIGLTAEFFLIAYNGFERRSIAEISLCFYFGGFVMMRWKQAEEKLKVSLNELQEAKIDTAIANSVKVLAHDIRAPFSSLHMMLDNIHNAMDAKHVVMLRDELLPEIKSRLSSVNEMVNEVLEVSASNVFSVSSQSLSDIIQSVLSSSCIHNQIASIRISYLYNHSHKILVNTSKIERAIYNVVSNALDAMEGFDKHLWFASEEVDSENGKLIQLTIGNSGSFIDENYRQKIFDPFFTQKSRNGTGLGLTIAKKFIDAHGGHIWCDSSHQKGTEFKLTLPASLDYEDQKPPSPGFVYRDQTSQSTRQYLS
jgi:signal transduction histidine kinase